MVNAWVTLATNDSYAIGALVLASSLRRVDTVHQLVVMITPGVSSAMRQQLGLVFDSVAMVNVLDSNDVANLALLARPDLGITFTKLHCWTLTDYEKCVFLDADTFVIRGCDELFQRDELSASPDIGWPDCFNSGVFVFRPSNLTFQNLLTFAMSRGSFDGGDQGLLNLFFSDWSVQSSARRLPFIYNMCSTGAYSYLPAFKQFSGNAKIVHFIGPVKPWLHEINTQSGLVKLSGGDSVHILPFLQDWWDLFIAAVLPSLQDSMSGMAGALAQLSIGQPRTEAQTAMEEHWRKQAWEHGQIDYLGKDAFDFIWAKICNTLTTAPESASEQTLPPSEPEPANEAAPTPDAALPQTTACPPHEEPVSEMVPPSTPPFVLQPPKPSVQTPAPVSSPPISPTSPITPASFPSPPTSPTSTVVPASIPSPPTSPTVSAAVPSPPTSPTSPVVPVSIPSPPTSPTSPIVLASIPSPPTSPVVLAFNPSPPISPISPVAPAAVPSPPTSPVSLTSPGAPAALSAVKLPSPPVSPLSKRPASPPPPLSPPLSPRTAPRTPTVTDATPPTSPPIVTGGNSPRALAVGIVTPPATPPVGTTGGGLAPSLQAATQAQNQSEVGPAPIPPKRRGGPSKGGKAALQKGNK